MTREELLTRLMSIDRQIGTRSWITAIGDLGEIMDELREEINHEPDLPDDLDEAADKYEQEYFTDATLGEAYITGAEWQKEQMMKEAVEGEIQMRYSGCLCAKTIRAINEDKFKLGDKVRIIIVKEE